MGPYLARRRPELEFQSLRILFEFIFSDWDIYHPLNHQRGGQVVSNSQRNYWR